MSWKLAYYLVPTLLCSTMHALVEQKIDEKKPLSIVFSKSSHNRISIECGSVEKIFGDETYFNINIDRTTGNAFVNVLREIPELTTLTVVTSTGLIQDLAVTSADKPSEHLILREEDEEKDLIETASDFHGHTIEFLNQILEGKTPMGYCQTDPLDKDNLELPHPLVVSAIKVFEGPFEEIVVYSIKNAGKDPIIVNSDSLKKEKASWVFLNAHELRAREQALCIISSHKNES